MPEHDAPWTPGPWCFTNGQLLRVCKPTAAPVTICGVHRIGKFSGRDDSEAIANGRLIAAAPSLYEAVVALLDWMEQVTTVGCDPSVAAAALDKAHAALAIAHGETNG